MWLEYSVVGEDRRIGVVVSQAVWRGARGGWLRCVALRRSPSLPQPSAADGTRDEDSDYSFGREQVMLVRYNASMIASLPVCLLLKIYYGTSVPCTFRLATDACMKLECTMSRDAGICNQFHKQRRLENAVALSKSHCSCIMRYSNFKARQLQPHKATT